MQLEFDDHAFSDLRHWVKFDRKKAEKIMELIEEVRRTPFQGSGKPEPLKHTFAGCWSRRIDPEHRLVYKVDGNRIRILACRYHY